MYKYASISISNTWSLNPNRAEIFSHLIHARGGGSYMTPPLSPVIAVIKGQTEKQMIKFCKKTNFEQFYNGFYRYLTVKPPQPLFILMLLEGAFFIQLISNSMKRLDLQFVTKFSFSCLPPLGGKQQ